MSDSPEEIAEATGVNVRETNVLHASDVVYWLDGSTGTSADEMSLLSSPLSLQFSNIPRDVKVLERPGKTAFMRKTTTPMIEGRASEAERTRSAEATFNVAGEAWDHNRRYNPVQFDLDLGNGAGHAVIMYPTPAAITVPAGGCVFGQLLTDTSEEPVLWALLELTITIPGSGDLIVRGQSDALGNFMLPLRRVPPLPSGTSDYSAELAVTANLANSSDSAPDLTTYSAFNLESTTSSSSFGAHVDLDIVPGTRMRVDSASKSFLALEEP